MTFLSSLKQEAAYFLSIDYCYNSITQRAFTDKSLKYDTTPLIGTLASTAHLVEVVAMFTLGLLAGPFLLVYSFATKGLKAFDMPQTLKFGKMVGGSIAMTLFFVANAATLGIVGYTAKRLQVAGHLPKAS